MTGQVWHHDRMMWCQQSGERSKRMGRCSGAMKQQHGRSVTHYLDMPAKTSCIDKTAERAVWPRAAITLPVQPITLVTHYITLQRRIGPPGGCPAGNCPPGSCQPRI